MNNEQYSVSIDTVIVVSPQRNRKTFPNHSGFYRHESCADVLLFQMLSHIAVYLKKGRSLMIYQLHVSNLKNCGTEKRFQMQKLRCVSCYYGIKL